MIKNIKLSKLKKVLDSWEIWSNDAYDNNKSTWKKSDDVSVNIITMLIKNEIDKRRNNDR